MSKEYSKRGDLYGNKKQVPNLAHRFNSVSHSINEEKKEDDKILGSRYPNYLPLLKAQRIEKQGTYSNSSRNPQIDQTPSPSLREPLDSELNRTVLKKAWKLNHSLNYKPFEWKSTARHEKRHHNVEVRKVESLFRAPHSSFSDTDSPLLQIDLAREQWKKVRDGGGTSGSYAQKNEDTKAAISEYIRKKGKF